MYTLPKKILALSSIATLAVCAACGPAPESTNVDADDTAPTMTTGSDIPAPQITGTVTYRERMALGPSAQLNIQLQDISLADIAANILAEKTIDNIGQVPVNFTLGYDPDMIEDRNAYAVRAVISDNGKMLFTTDTVYPVITRSNGNSVEMVLIRVPPAKSEKPAKLTGTYWKLSAVNGIEVAVAEDQRAAFLQFISNDNVARGYSGCNQFSGSWKIIDERIELGPMAMTMMACVEGMETETAFMQALDAMDRHAIQGEELRMFQGDKEVLLFKAAAQP